VTCNSEVEETLSILACMNANYALQKKKTPRFTIKTVANCTHNHG